MRSIVLAVLLLTPAAGLAAAKANPADFPLKLHITASAAKRDFSGGIPGYNFYQVVETSIDGQPVQLSSDNAQGVLALGDYPARIAPKAPTPKHPNTYDIYRYYELLLPDGTTRTFTVTRLGPAVPNP